MIYLCSKYVKNCNIFGQILNIWVKLILKKNPIFFFNVQLCLRTLKVLALKICGVLFRSFNSTDVPHSETIKNILPKRELQLLTRSFIFYPDYFVTYIHFYTGTYLDFKYLSTYFKDQVHNVCFKVRLYYQRRNCLHCAAENSIRIPNFQVRPKHILSATSAQFFRFP